MRIKTIMKKSSIIVLMLGLLIGTASYAVISNDKFPKNEKGETFGSIRDLKPNEKGPELIKAYTIDGKLGYVRAKDFFGETPKNPEEALKMKTDEPKEINVYESDGKTVIGKFVIKPAIVSYDGKKPKK